MLIFERARAHFSRSTRRTFFFIFFSIGWLIDRHRKTRLICDGTSIWKFSQKVCFLPVSTILIVFVEWFHFCSFSLISILRRFDIFHFRRVKGGHYVATRGRDTTDYAHANRGYWTDGEESQRAPSERTLSEYTTANERNTSPPHRPARRTQQLNHGPKDLGPTYGPPSRIPPRAPSALSYDHGGDVGSDIYVTSAAFKAPSEYSRYSAHRPNSRGPRSLYSVASSAKTGRSNRSRRAGMRVEAMSAPNPFCPNVKGICCLMLLLNLGLILVTLGFVIVIQFVEPLFVW